MKHFDTQLNIIVDSIFRENQIKRQINEDLEKPALETARIKRAGLYSMGALRSLEIISIKDTTRTHQSNTKQRLLISMCIIKKQFYILSDGRVWYEGKSYDPQDCEFLEGSYLVLNTIDEKIEKPSKKQAKIEPVHTIIERDLDMSLPLNLDMLITYPSITSQAPVTHTAIESPALPPEINQLQELIKLTGNNLPLAIAILIALVFYKDKKKKDQESQDHAVACDIERKDLLKRLDAIESEFKQFEKDQVKIMVGDGDIKDRIDRLERHVKNLQ